MLDLALESPRAGPWLLALDRVFADAVQVCGMMTSVLHIAGRRVRLRFAGAALREQVLPAFAHLLGDEDGQPAELTVNLFDGASSRLSPPPPPWPLSSYGARGEVHHGLLDRRLEVTFQTESGTLEVFVPDTGTAYLWVRDAARWPLWQLAAPLRTTLAHFARSVDLQLVHGAAVGLAAGAVLLSARGGSGKSTTALACLDAALFYLGDDYVCLGRPGGSVAATERRVFSLYGTAKLRQAEAAARLPRLEGASWCRGEPKSLLYLHPAFPERLPASLPLRAVLIPAFSVDAKTRLRPASTHEALQALAPTTVFQLPGSGPAVLGALANLLRDIPIYRLELGPRPADAAAAIKELLTR